MSLAPLEDLNQDHKKEKMFIVDDEDEPRKLVVWHSSENQFSDQFLNQYIRKGQGADHFAWLCGAAVANRKPGFPGGFASVMTKSQLAVEAKLAIARRVAGQANNGSEPAAGVGAAAATEHDDGLPSWLQGGSNDASDSRSGTARPPKKQRIGSTTPSAAAHAMPPPTTGCKNGGSSAASGRHHGYVERRR